MRLKDVVVLGKFRWTSSPASYYYLSCPYCWQSSARQFKSVSQNSSLNVSPATPTAVSRLLKTQGFALLSFSSRQSQSGSLLQLAVRGKGTIAQPAIRCGVGRPAQNKVRGQETSAIPGHKVRGQETLAQQDPRKTGGAGSGDPRTTSDTRKTRTGNSTHKNNARPPLQAIFDPSTAGEDGRVPAEPGSVTDCRFRVCGFHPAAGLRESRRATSVVAAGGWFHAEVLWVCRRR